MMRWTRETGHRLVMLRGISWRRWRFLAESTLFLALAAAAIAFLPFARVARLAGGRRAARPAREADKLLVDEIRCAIETIARRLPFRAKCFECGLAAQWMLRRRGLASTLFYGAALDASGGLSAHVWVRAGILDVVGCRNAADFAILARFPADEQPAQQGVSSSLEISRPPRS